MESTTSTPVGNPLTSTRPALRSSTGTQAARGSKVARIHVDRGRQLTFEATRKLFHLIGRLHAHHKAERSEDLFAECVIGEELRARRLE